MVLIVTAVAFSFMVQAQQTMTAEKFREIASSPGDDVTLNTNLLAAGPLWTNATVTVDLMYADGKKFHEAIPASIKTVKGNYLVATINSSLYKQPVNTIGAYEEATGCYKVWALYGEMLTESTMVCDTNKRIYSFYSAYGGTLEYGVGSWNATNKWSHTLIMKEGVLFCTRDISSIPAKPDAK